MIELGLTLNFERCFMTQDNAEIPMQPPDWLQQQKIEEFEQELFMIHDPITTDAERIQKILDIKY